MSQRARKRNSSQTQNHVRTPSQRSPRSQPQTSQASQASSGTENYEQYVVSAMKFILIRSTSKHPIKRADIVKECTNGEVKIFQIILPLVQDHLKSIYGILFKEVKSTTKSTNIQYICVSTVETVSLLKLKKADRRDQSLLSLILPYIYIKGTSISEGGLLTFLERLGIQSNVEHEYFGDVKKYLDLFHKQLYISRTKVTVENSNEEKVLLVWGERANIEFDKRKILEETAKVFHKPTNYFRKQHMELKKAEQQDVEMAEA